MAIVDAGQCADEVRTIIRNTALRAHGRDVLAQTAILRDLDRRFHVLRIDNLELLYLDAGIVKQNLLGILEPRARERDLVLMPALDAGRIDIRELRRRGTSLILKERNPKDQRERRNCSDTAKRLHSKAQGRRASGAPWVTERT